MNQMETERILLRHWQESDAETLFKYASDPDVGPRAGWPAHKSVEESREIIRTYFHNDTTWAIVLKETGEAIGCIGYYTHEASNIPIGENDCEVGYWVGKTFWNRGICTEALKMMLNYCIHEKHFENIWADHFTGNPASGKVMEKCGFSDTGMLNQCSLLVGGDKDMVKVFKYNIKTYQIMKKIKLSNGVEMPQLGYGVYQVEPDECERCVLDALSVGYRMIDTAQAYLNEEAVGNAWKKSGISRDEIFLVSKVWHSNYGEGQTMKSIDESLRKLQTDYIDLMLLHQPYCDRYGAYRDLEKAYKAGKVRAIGVSNFFPDHLIDLASNMEIAPMVNQMETHVFNQQHETRRFMDEYGTHLMAWAPLAEGQNGLFTNPTLTQIGEKYGKTAAQVALRWLLQSDVIIIPKTIHKERMQENLSLFDFELDADDMQAIAKLDTAHSLFLDHHSGETTKQFMEWRAVVKPTE